MCFGQPVINQNQKSYDFLPKSNYKCAKSAKMSHTFVTLSVTKSSHTRLEIGKREEKNVHDILHVCRYISVVQMASAMARQISNEITLRYLSVALTRKL